MRILHAVETLSRNAGGLPVAVTELAAALARLDDGEELGCEVVSSPTKNAIAIDEGVTVRQVAGVRRWLATQEPETFSVVHQHGIWARLPTATGRWAKRSGIPLLLSPHGMLEPWALGHHAWRKRVAMAVYQRRNIESAQVLHATSPAEAERFRELGLTQPIAEISLGIDPPVFESPSQQKAKEKRQVLFLSRIHPKKGVDLLLDAWAKIDAPDWELVIAGNDDGGHQASLEAQVAKLGLNERVRLAGPVFGAEKDAIFRQADLFVLPSYSENFGIVVPEALQYGVPVITTKGTPWEVLERDQCGWQVAATTEAIGEAVTEAIALSDEERRAMGERGRAVVERDHRWPGIAARYRDVYRWMIGESERPDCVRPFGSP